MARISRKNINAPSITEIVKAVLHQTGLYGRLSVDGERSEDSIETQVNIMKDFLNGKVDFEITKIYKDVGFTGRNQNRPEFIKIMEDINAKKVDCVVVKDLSRLGRNHLEVSELIFRFFKIKNVRFISVNDNYDSFTDDAKNSKLILLFKNLMNHWYSEDLGKKVKSAMETKQKKGDIFGSVPTYGYFFEQVGERKSDKKLAIQEEAAEVVRLIFSLRLQGMSAYRISEYLNDNDYPSPMKHYYDLGIVKHEKYNSKVFWGTSRISKFLSNPVYIGDLVLNKHYEKNGKVFTQSNEQRIIHENHHKPLICVSDFEKVQKLLLENREFSKSKGQNKHSENIFVGKIFCTCGKPIMRCFAKNKNGISYFFVCKRCRRELRKGKSRFPQLRQTDLEKASITFLNNETTNCLSLKTKFENMLISKTTVSKVDEIGKSITNLENQASNKENFITNAFQDLADGILNENEYKTAVSKFRADIFMMNSQIEALKEEQQQLSVENVNRNSWIKNFCNNKGFKVLTNELILTFIDKIIVDPSTSGIEIVVNFKNEYNSILSCFQKVGDYNE